MVFPIVGFCNLLSNLGLPDLLLFLSIVGENVSVFSRGDS